MPDLNQMLIFVRVVEDGSFSAAAQALGMAKSTVSQHITQLEERLGVRLLQRTPRQLHLTDAGAEYFRRAQDLIRAAGAAEAAVTAFHDMPRGTLRVTAPRDLAPGLVPVIEGFLRMYPEVTIDLLVDDSMIDLVSEGYDVALRAGAIDSASLVVRRLGQERTVICAAPRYLAARGRVEHPRDLATHDAVVRRSHRVWRFRPGGPGNAPGSGEDVIEVEPRARLMVNDIPTLRASAVAGLGIAWLAWSQVAAHVRAGALEILLPDWPLVRVPLQLIYPSRRQLDPKVRAFVDHVVAAAAEVLPWEVEPG
jgi:DNA-binding transcriptional LysR family regulator